jgi:hypothetical protein
VFLVVIKPSNVLFFVPLENLTTRNTTKGTMGFKTIHSYVAKVVSYTITG